MHDLRQVARKVTTKRIELESVDSTDHELLDINRFMEIYRTVRPDENLADAEFEEKEGHSAAELN